MDSPTISASSSPKPRRVSWQRTDHRRRWCDKRLYSAPVIVMAGGSGSQFLPHSVNFCPCYRMRRGTLLCFTGLARDCDGATPRRDRVPLASQPDLSTLKRWLRLWVAVRHREGAERI